MVVKKIFKKKPERRRRRPRLRWLNSVEKDLREMKVKKWWHEAMYSEEWAYLKKEAEVLGRP
jgi:hypothetical protein